MTIINRGRYIPIPLLITVGLLLTPTYYHAPDNKTPAMITVSTESKQETAISTTETPDSAPCPSTFQKLTLKFKPILKTLSGAAALASAPYLIDRSIVAAHEGSHLMAAMLSGYRGDMYISPKFWGGGCMSHNCPAGNPMRGLIALAGPLGGVAAYLAWLQIWNIAMRYWNSGNVKESVLEGKKDPLFNKDSSFLAIGGAFCGIYEHYRTNMIPMYVILNDNYGKYTGILKGNDGVSIQNALANIAPFLAKAYPFLAYAGLAGLMSYGVYGVYATYKAKKEAGIDDW